MAEAKDSKTAGFRALRGSVYFWLLVGSLVTGLAMYGHRYLPEKRLQLVHSDTFAYIYADDQNHADWVDADGLQWRCEIENPHRQAFCGFHISVGGEYHEGRDFSRYSHIKLDLDYSGDSSFLRYYLRNREVGFSDPGNPETHKFMQSQIAVDFIPEGLVISLDEFYVAEWWLSDFEVPRALSRPAFDDVTAFGIDLAYPAVEGEHIAQLHSAELVGVWVSREQWYAGIMALWILVISLGGATRLVQLRKSVVIERERRARIAEKNRQLRQQSDQLREISHKDQLTGLLNRHGAAEVIDQLFASQGALLSLLVLDIDHFKPLNDDYGHNVGDQVLARIGALLRDNVRQSDAAVRWGGEEFVVLLPYTSALDAAMIADKLRAKISQLTYDVLPGKNVTVSVGVGERLPGENYEQFFNRVDAALYKAKAAGRNQVRGAS